MENVFERNCSKYGKILVYKNKTHERKCPKCNKILKYKFYSKMVAADKKNSLCRSCANRNIIRKPHTSETKEKMSEAQKGEKNHMFGKQLSQNSRNKISEAAICWRLKNPNFHRGANNPNWKGGITNLNVKIRTCSVYDDWRFACYKRDKNICQLCGCKKNLHCHHIIYFSDLIEQFNIKTLEQAILCENLWDTNNGITLCKNCHIKIHKNDLCVEILEESIKVD